MSYWTDPERKRIALEKRAISRAEMGPRLRPSKIVRRDVLPPSTGGARRTPPLGNAHPTRDSPG